MSDDRLDDGLNAYADNVRRTVHPAGGADVRRAGSCAGEPSMVTARR